MPSSSTRPAWRWLLGLGGLALAACGGDDPPSIAEETPPIASETAPEATPLAAEVEGPDAAHGGTVVAVGPRHVEVVVHDDGALEAYLDDDLPAPATAQITVRVATEGGAIQPVVMIWDPASERYRGQIYAELPVPGPLAVTLVVDGATSEGESPFTRILAPVDEPSAPRAQPTARATVEVEAPAPPAAGPPSPPPSARAVVAPPPVAPPPPPTPPAPPPPPAAEVRVRAVQTTGPPSVPPGQARRRGRRVRVRVAD
jgi:hypothetical protein